MPPKAFMKFKPKTDTRQNIEVKREEDVDQTVSAFQQQRLQQEQQGGGGGQGAASGGTSVVGGVVVDGGAPSRDGGQAGGGAAGGKDGGKDGGPGGRRSNVITLPSTTSGGLATASHGAGGSIKTDVMPGNTVEDLKNFVDPVTNDTRFLPIQSMPKLPADPAAETLLQQKEERDGREMKIEGESRPVGEEAPKKKKDGTAFLREHLQESALSRQQNLNFFTLNGQGAIGGNTAGGGIAGEEQKMVWMQLPSPQLGSFQRSNAAGNAGPQSSIPNLSTIPPGKVGKMRVRKSGKTELIIGDTAYEVILESVPSQASMSSEVVAILPSPAGDGSTSCYELGSVDRKAVCIAVPTESTS